MQPKFVQVANVVIALEHVESVTFTSDQLATVHFRSGHAELFGGEHAVSLRRFFGAPEAQNHPPQPAS